MLRTSGPNCSLRKAAMTLTTYKGCAGGLRSMDLGVPGTALHPTPQQRSAAPPSSPHYALEPGSAPQTTPPHSRTSISVGTERTVSRPQLDTASWRGDAALVKQRGVMDGGKGKVS